LTESNRFWCRRISRTSDTFWKMEIGLPVLHGWFCIRRGAGQLLLPCHAPQCTPGLRPSLDFAPCPIARGQARSSSLSASRNARVPETSSSFSRNMDLPSTTFTSAQHGASSNRCSEGETEAHELNWSVCFKNLQNHRCQRWAGEKWQTSCMQLPKPRPLTQLA